MTKCSQFNSMSCLNKAKRYNINFNNSNFKIGYVLQFIIIPKKSV